MKNSTVSQLVAVAGPKSAGSFGNPQSRPTSIDLDLNTHVLLEFQVFAPALVFGRIRYLHSTVIVLPLYFGFMSEDCYSVSMTIERASIDYEREAL